MLETRILPETTASEGVKKLRLLPTNNRYIRHNMYTQTELQFCLDTPRPRKIHPEKIYFCQIHNFIQQLEFLQSNVLQHASLILQFTHEWSHDNQIHHHWKLEKQTQSIIPLNLSVSLSLTIRTFLICHDIKLGKNNLIYVRTIFIAKINSRISYFAGIANIQINWLFVISKIQSRMSVLLLAYK